MNLTNQKYTCFKKMVDGHKTFGQEGEAVFSSSVMSWLMLEDKNPFAAETEEHTIFDRMMQHYISIQKNTVGSRYSRKQALAEAHKLCDMKVKNPYRFDKKADLKDQEEKKALEEAQRVAMEEATRRTVEAEAARIVQAEEAKKAEAERRAKIKAEMDKQRAEAQAKKDRLLQQAIEAKRIEEQKKQEELRRLAEEQKRQQELEEKKQEELKRQEDEKKVQEALKTLESLKHVVPETSVELFGVVPSDTGDYDGDDFELEPYVEEPVKDETPKEKIGFFRKLFGRKHDN